MQRRRLLGGSLGLEEVDVQEKISEGFDGNKKSDNKKLTMKNFVIGSPNMLYSHQITLQTTMSMSLPSVDGVLHSNDLGPGMCRHGTANPNAL